MDQRRQDLEFCWEQILRLDPWFKLNFLFAPREFEDQIVGLHGLFASIDMALRIEEADLARGRLAWLASELGSAGSSEFPTVRLLHGSGALEQIPDALMSALLEDAHYRAESVRPSQITDLKRTGNQVGWARMALELCVSGLDPNSAVDCKEHCAGSGVHFLLRASREMHAGAALLVPLEHLARHQLTSGELVGDSTAASDCRQAISSSLVRWAEEQGKALGDFVRDNGIDGAIVRHLVAFVQVRRRQFRRWDLLDRGRLRSPWGISDLLRVWTECRRLRGGASLSRS